MYENFDDYALNDRKYLLAALSGRLFEPMDEVAFKDGTSYEVERYVSSSDVGYTRMWRRDGEVHREDGPAIIFDDGSEMYYLNGNWYMTKNSWNLALRTMR